MDGTYCHNHIDVCRMPFCIGKGCEECGAWNDQAGSYYVVDVNTNHTVDVNHQRHTPPYAIYPNAPMYYDYCLDETSFVKLYNKVKNTSFDDNKFDLLEVASLGCFYSCNQVARMMSIFTFGDKQLKVLSMMASHIVDPQNAIAIYNVLTFDSEKAKAGEILKNSRKHK